MVPQGQPPPLGGGHSVPSSLLRSNSNLMGGQGGSMSSQSGFPSLVSPRTQFNGGNMLGNVPNVSSLLQQSYGNGGPSSSLGNSQSQRDGIHGGDGSDPLAGLRNGMDSNTPSSSFGLSNQDGPGHMSGQQFSNSPGNQMLLDQQSAQQIESQNFQQSHQSLQQNRQHQHQQQQQQQYQNIRGGLGGIGQVKLEPQMTNYQHGQNTQQLQALRNLGPVKMEMQHTSNLPPVKLEPQQSDQSLFLQQQQQQHQHQQQQLLNMSRQPSQAAAAAQINLLHQQRLLQLHQQQQLLKNIPQQRSPMQPQFQQQNAALRSAAKPVYEPGMCARRLTHYMYQQQHRPEDNSIEFWRKFVAEYFAPNAKKKWCVSLYGSGRHTTGVFPQDVWHCEICNKKPGRGFEANVEVLPRLFKIKYESGTLEELLYVDMPREYQNSSGQIVLDYAKAIQESVFEQLRVVRDGQLRIVFTSDLKICSWEFCARHHEELIPRKLLIPQISQLGNAAQKYQASTNNASSQSAPELQTNCNMFVASARQLAKALEVPLVNDLGYTKRYVRCLQISEVVNSMKDLIDYSRETSIGPMECLAKFPRRISTTSGLQSQPQQPEQQQQATQQQQNSNGMSTVNNSNPIPVTSSNGTIAGLLHQNSINSRHQQNFKNTPQTSQNGASILNSVGSPNMSTGEADPNDSQSSVQKILHEMMSSSQLGGSGGDVKNFNNSGIVGNGQSGMVNGIRAAMGHNNSFGMNGRVTSHQQQQQQQQDMGNQLLNGIGAVNGFNNIPFDWKSSP